MVKPVTCIVFDNFNTKNPLAPMNAQHCPGYTPGLNDKYYYYTLPVTENKLNELYVYLLFIFIMILYIFIWIKKTIVYVLICRVLQE